MSVLLNYRPEFAAGRAWAATSDHYSGGSAHQDDNQTVGFGASPLDAVTDLAMKLTEKLENRPL